MSDRSSSPTEHLVRAVALRKAFGGIVALKSANLAVRAGTIHALVGENGAGKSTALGAIAGRLRVDSGSIFVGGTETTGISPRAAQSLGVAAIYQELTILPKMSACANVFLGQEAVRGGFLERSVMFDRYRALCQRVGVSIPPGVKAGDLSVADQQMLEIMRALASGARIILFDEPTSSLVNAERETLFRIMRELRTSGVTMVLVSHNLNEVLSISDDITVFRNGESTQTGPTSQWTRDALLAAMLGKAAPDLLASHRASDPVDAQAQPLIRVDDLHVPGILQGVSIQAHRGEILGVAGLVGSGRTTLLRAIAGLEPSARGSLVVDGVVGRWPTTARQSRRLGIALIPEDRKGQGLLMHMSSRENIGISNLARYSRAGFVRRSKMKREIRDVAQEFELDPSRLEQPVRNLSGGNQQKVLLARWHLAQPEVLLADEPTRGIDVGAKAAILTSLRASAAAGATVIVVSSELDELTVLADRVVVLAGGRLVEEFVAGGTGVRADLMLSAAFSE
ncbi:sugar ABC transporter ATP-binding protein [Acidothermaceae bacterium B102]|nr:sugar ABC transporter ATP-binding protein [Acidothermaceae bacterium B102]